MGLTYTQQLTWNTANHQHWIIHHFYGLLPFQFLTQSSWTLQPCLYLLSIHTTPSICNYVGSVDIILKEHVYLWHTRYSINNTFATFVAAWTPSKIDISTSRDNFERINCHRIHEGDKLTLYLRKSSHHRWLDEPCYLSEPSSRPRRASAR